MTTLRWGIVFFVVGCVYVSPAGTRVRPAERAGAVLGDRASGHPVISADGRYVAFDSWAGNLVPGDTNQTRDVFVRDRRTARTTRVSVAWDGAQANGGSSAPSISADGRWVAFTSIATNLALRDNNKHGDVFVHDRTTGESECVSVTREGVPGADFSNHASVSGNGRYVAFVSGAHDLVPGDENWLEDVFVRDRQAGKTTLASVGQWGIQVTKGSRQAAISADGRHVAFASWAGGLVWTDTNRALDVFVHDRLTKETVRVSVTSEGTQGNGNSQEPSVSGDGRYVAFHSDASNLVPGDSNDSTDVFVHDRTTGKTECVSMAPDGTAGNGRSRNPSISADGRFVAFNSLASNLVAGDTNGKYDVFVRDRITGKTTRVSVAWNGEQGNGHSSRPSMSADGRYVAFCSSASNLVSGDANCVSDVFVHDRVAGKTVCVSVACKVGYGAPRDRDSSSQSE